MDMPEVKAFNAELSGLYDNKPPISKAKMSAITRGAIKAIKFYKHVVHSVEKFIQKCKPEYKVPGLYVIDSIVRQSRHQFGQDKDVFAPRFAKNMQQTFANLFRCPPEDKRNIIRVLNLWQKNNVFSSQVIQPLLDMADPNHPLHQEIQQQQNNTANGSSLNLSHNTSDNKMSPTQHSPRDDSPMGGDQFQDEPEPQPKFNRKLLNDFEYDSEDEPPAETSAHTSHTSHGTHASHGAHSHQSHGSQQHNTQNPADALGSILTNPEIMRQLQSLQAQMQMMTGMQIPNFMPMMSDLQMQQNQNQSLPFMSSQQDMQKQSEPKDDIGNNESDIEFVETGPQVIEIPDANDSSPSPKSRRHRSRSKSPRRRRRSRSRSRSPRRRRDRDRDRDGEREREKDRDNKDREKSYKDREMEKEKQREREKKGLPPIKKENLSVCSTTLWVGHLSKLATPEELSDLFGGVGGVASIDVVAPRGCAFVVMERRRDANKAIHKLNKHKLHSKEITVAWAPGKGVKGREWKDYWEADLGVSYLPWGALHQRWTLGALSLDALEDGGAVDEDTLPPWLPPRILPKSVMENMTMMAGMPPPGANMLANMPPGGMPNMTPGNMPPGNIPNMPPGSMPNMAPGSMAIPNLSNLPTNLAPGNLTLPTASLAGGLPPVSLAPNLTTLAGGNLSLPPNMPTPNAAISMAIPRMPPPGMGAGMPPGMPAGIPPGIRPPSIPAGVTGIPTDTGLPPAGSLLRFPPGIPPQTMPQPGMVGGFLGGLLGVGVGVGVGVGGLVGGVPLLHHAPLHSAHAHTTPPPAIPQPTRIANEVTQMAQSDDAMDLDTEEIHEDTNGETAGTADAPPILSEQLQALLSKPPPTFNASEPPPGFNMSEPPPFNVNQPPPSTEEKQEDDKKDRDRDRRDRERDRRDRDRGDRRDRDRRDRDRGRDSGRDSGRDRDRGDREERRDRDRDRGGRDRRDRDRERDRDRDRYSNRTDNNRDRSREKSPRTANTVENPEKSLQDRLWEMANGKPREEKREDADPREPSENRERTQMTDRPNTRHDCQTTDIETENEPVPSGPGGDSGWTQLPPPRLPPPHMAPHFRAELRMNGPPRPPMQGPWMEGPGPGPFGPRFNGMGPPPFNRPPFDGPPMFEGGPRFERPPFGRIPFDPMNRPPFDGPRPPFDGLRPPFEGLRPPFDGPRPPFDGMRPPFDGPRPPFDGPRPPFDGIRPPFDGSSFDEDRPPFEGPSRFDGPPDFFERGRRFDDREQYQERGWNGAGDRDRGDREWDRDRRPDWDDRSRSRPRPREHDDRYNRDRSDRRRSYDDNRSRKQTDTPKQSDNNYLPDTHKQTDISKSVDPPQQIDVPKEERNPRRDRDRKSRWGAAEDISEITENIESTLSDNGQEQMATPNKPDGDVASTEHNIEQLIASYEDQNVKSEKNSIALSEIKENRESPKTDSHDDQSRSSPKNLPVVDNVSGAKSREREENIDDTNEEREDERQNSQQAYKSMVKENPDSELIGKEAVTNLYDADEAMDTSFSISAPAKIDTLPPSVEHEEEPFNRDIFINEIESKENTEDA